MRNKHHKHDKAGKKIQSFEEMQQSNILKIWKNVGVQANDNGMALCQKKRPVFFLLTAMFFLALIGANSSKIFTTVILRSDNTLLEKAMDVNPDAVAFALNQMNIGE